MKKRLLTILSLALALCALLAMLSVFASASGTAEESEGEIISRFLRKTDYRIVAEEGEVDSEIRTEAEIDEEDDLVSEELAEIYLAQGLKCEAIEIYRKLSLLNSEKSAYFAEKIENIEKNN